MRGFATLLDRLAYTPARNDKLRLMADYFRTTPDPERGWALAVLTFTLPGMPLIYNGQEAGLSRRLAFFEKDLIDWRDAPQAAFYRRLIALKHRHPALAAPPHGGTLTLLPAVPEVVAFERRRGADVVRVAVNLSAQPQVWEGHALPAWGWEIA